MAHIFNGNVRIMRFKMGKTW